MSLLTSPCCTLVTLPQRVRETINGWGKATRRKRQHGLYGDDSTIRTETSTVASVEEYDQFLMFLKPLQLNVLSMICSFFGIGKILSQYLMKQISVNKP